MSHSSNTKKHVGTCGNSLNTQPPITIPQVYSPQQKSTLWDSVKMGFGMSMGSRMFGFIFGDPTVKVEHKNQPPPTIADKEQNTCDTLIEQIKFYQCDNQKCYDNQKYDENQKCDELYRQFYKCQKKVM
jgi:hypothetical protein